MYSLYDHVLANRVEDVSIERAAKLKAYTVNSKSLLHYARSKEMVELLVNRGLDLEQTSSFGCTPLHTALTKHETPNEVILALIKAGVNIHAKNKFGNTALHYMYLHGYHTDLLHALVDAGADVNAKNDIQTKPIEYVRSIMSICFLCDLGADFYPRRQEWNCYVGDRAFASQILWNVLFV